MTSEANCVMWPVLKTKFPLYTKNIFYLVISAIFQHNKTNPNLLIPLSAEIYPPKVIYPQPQWPNFNASNIMHHLILTLMLGTVKINQLQWYFAEILLWVSSWFKTSFKCCSRITFSFLILFPSPPPKWHPFSGPSPICNQSHKCNSNKNWMKKIHSVVLNTWDLGVKGLNLDQSGYSTGSWFEDPPPPQTGTWNHDRAKHEMATEMAASLWFWLFLENSLQIVTNFLKSNYSVPSIYFCEFYMA